MEITLSIGKNIELRSIKCMLFKNLWLIKNQPKVLVQTEDIASHEIKYKVFFQEIFRHGQIRV